MFNWISLTIIFVFNNLLLRTGINWIIYPIYIYPIFWNVHFQQWPTHGTGTQTYDYYNFIRRWKYVLHGRCLLWSNYVFQTYYYNFIIYDVCLRFERNRLHTIGLGSLFSLPASSSCRRHLVGVFFDVASVPSPVRCATPNCTRL